VVRLSSEPDAPASDVSRIIDAIEEWNMAVTGVRDYHPIAIFVRDDDDSFQAPDLYRRLGYKAFGEIEDYPPGHTHLFLRKDLG
jgi:hypothetical protein